MTFHEWLQRREMKEAATDTGDVATFARPVLAGSRRMYPPPVVLGEKDKKQPR